ncbi:MAG: hypothetical protein Q7S84_03895 [bacterium]|nr:hypothetical protein [bacterium]
MATVKKTKQPARKTAAKRPAAQPKPKLGKPIGIVTHFFDHISVGIVKFSKPVKVGATVRFLGAHTDFTQPIASMQYDHQPIAVAKKAQEIGIKVKEKVHEGNKVYLTDKS